MIQRFIKLSVPLAWKGTFLPLALTERESNIDSLLFFPFFSFGIQVLKHWRKHQNTQQIFICFWFVITEDSRILLLKIDIINTVRPLAFTILKAE